MSDLREGIAQLRATLDRYAGVETTLADIEADIVTACQQLVAQAGATPKAADPDAPQPAKATRKGGPRPKWRVPAAKPTTPRAPAADAPPTQHAEKMAALATKMGRVLTARESSVAEAVFDGFTINEIADTLQISYGSVYPVVQRLGLSARQARKR